MSRVYSVSHEDTSGGSYQVGVSGKYFCIVLPVPVVLNHSEFAALTCSKILNEKVLVFSPDLVSVDDARCPQTRAGDHT